MFTLILGIVTVGILLYAIDSMVAVRVEMGKADVRTETDHEDPALFTPDFEGLERLFGMPLPDDLRWLYRQTAILTKQSVSWCSTNEPSEAYCVDHFLPATPETMKGTWFDIGPRRFPFAMDTFDNYLEREEGHDAMNEDVP